LRCTCPVLKKLTLSQGLFGGIGPVTRVRIDFDRAGRSEGVATVTYHHIEDAKRAIREFDGANAKGQQIRLTLLPARGGGASSRAEKSKSLFDRIERPGARNARSLSPSSDGGAGGRRRRRGGGAGGRGAAGGGSGGGAHRSDVSKPAPENIDRYVPGQRSPVRRNAGGGGGGRRPGERRDEKRRDAAGRGRGGGGGEGGRTAGSGPRPKKTQEELDQEMDDYWGTTNTTTETVTAAAAPAAETVAVESAPAAADDDIDMIE
jgi:THO complex subunit 4